MRHYIRTGWAVFGNELVAVSEIYLQALLPSHRETGLGAVGGFLVGTGLVQVLTAFLLDSSWFRLATGAGFVAGGVYCWHRQRRLRQGRMNFIKSEQAQSVKPKEVEK